MNAIRILIADDHPVFRFGLRALLNAMPDTEVVGEVTAGDEVIALAPTLRPDVILMDINMPGMNGIEATRRIREANLDIRILMVTMLEDDSVFAAMRAGAHGYVVRAQNQRRSSARSARLPTARRSSAQASPSA
jgi:DNA-binding NarL/FixJ family response regulator